MEIKLISGWSQVMADEPDMQWDIIFLTKNDVLYCINKSVYDRRFYGKVDIVVSGWKIVTDEPEKQIESSKKNNMKGENYTLTDLTELQLNKSWSEIEHLSRAYFEAPDGFYLIDGSFEIKCSKKDPYALSMENFQDLFDAQCN